VVGVSYNSSAAGLPHPGNAIGSGDLRGYQWQRDSHSHRAAGKTLALTMTGDGVPSPSLADGCDSAASSSLAYKPASAFYPDHRRQPAFLASYGIASGAYGTTTMNVTIPAAAPTGPQPVVVTVGGISSPPVNVTITAPPPPA